MKVRFIARLLAIIFAGVFLSFGQGDERFVIFIESGERYLEKKEYDQAIRSFSSAIRIYSWPVRALGLWTGLPWKERF